MDAHINKREKEAMAKMISFEKAQKAKKAKNQKNGKTVNRLVPQVKYVGYHPLRRQEGVSAAYFRTLDASRKYALAAFRQTLASFRRPNRVTLPDDFDEIMQNPRGVLPAKTHDKLIALPIKKKQQLVFAMATAAHDGWVRDNPQFFFDLRYSKERFVYLPVELCGQVVYEEFLWLISDLIEQLGIRTSNFDWDSESMYKSKRHRFVCEHGLTSENLGDYIKRCGADYVALSPEISEALRKDPVLVNELVSQVNLLAPYGGIEFC